MQDFALGVAYVVLQLGQKRHGSCCGHVLEGVFLPVLAQNLSLGRHLGVEVAGDDFLLLLVRHHAYDAVAVAVDGFVEFLAAPCARGKHHLCAGFQVLAVMDVVDVGVLAVALAYDGLLELLCQIEEGVAHAANVLCLLVPFLHLCRVVLHLLVEGAVDALIDLRGILGTLLQPVSHKREPVQYVARHVECKHGQQDQVHQVDHLLTRGDSFLLYRHCFLNNRVILNGRNTLISRSTLSCYFSLCAVPGTLPMLMVRAPIMRA